MKFEMERELSSLIGMPLWGMGMAASMQMFDFGECHEVMEPDGTGRMTGERALHVFCAWRIRSATQIVVASYDRCRKINLLTHYVENFGRDEKFDEHLSGESQGEQRGKAFLADKADLLTVLAVEIDNVGGFQLVFDKGFWLEVFPDCSIEGFEHWRLRKPLTDLPDFVIRVPLSEK